MHSAGSNDEDDDQEIRRPDPFIKSSSKRIFNNYPLSTSGVWLQNLHQA